MPRPVTRGLENVSSLILAIDCCFDSCSAALFDGRDVLACAFELMQRGQAERLTLMVQDVLARSGGAQIITAVAVTKGPGTFTGVRIGLAFARAFALARNVPCIGISALEAVALAEGRDGLRAAAFPAAQGVYVAAYLDGAVALEPALLSLDEAAARLPDGPVLIAGAARLELAEELGGRARTHGPDLPDARALARLAIGRPPGDNPPNPLYLRAPDIRAPKRAISIPGMPQ